MATIVPVVYHPAARPVGWQRVLQSLDRGGLKNGVLYGGALRDYDNGQQDKVSDYDIALFLQGGEETARRAIAELQHASYTELSKNNFQIRVDYVSVPLHIVFYDGGQPTAEHLASGADLGLCGIAMSIDGHVWAHPKYISDRRDKTLTLLNQEPRTRLRAERLKREKYPTYRLVDDAYSPSRLVPESNFRDPFPRLSL